ncbi:family 43 glycosylhydrolase [Flavicella sediminum]|uniref:family 43 glycosylhydrolase n=1 Tax=Flavicella sediminum TaxID=2585141 RepID=UPI001121A4E1|nr:family 43 glycosylhydrolase [Flavicella sediminum]
MKIIFKSLLILFLVIHYSGNISAQNPIMRGYADPAMKVHNGKMYMAIGKDKAIGTKGFNMPYWTIISSTDLRDWKVETHIDPKDTYLGKESMRCWAADLAFKDDKVFFYFSNGGLETGLLVADQPEGPYVDIYNKAFLPKEMSTNYEYDPTTFTDDDGKNYLIYGRNGFFQNKMLYYQLIELNEDMVSIKGKPISLKTDTEFGFGENGRARDHQYFHKYGDTYYLSCAGIYRTSKNIEGPYINERSTGQPKGHTSFANFNGQSYHAWEFTCAPYDNRAYRQTMMTYLHYKDNGDMLSDLNFVEGGKYYETGVGSYNANWDTIEAEWFFKKSEGIVKKEGQGGFVLKNIQNNDFVNFPNMIKMKKDTRIHFNIASKSKGGTIEIRLDSPTGEIIGTCAIPYTKKWSSYKTVSAQLTNKEKTHNLYFVFKGKKGELAHLNSFSIKK